MAKNDDKRRTKQADDTFDVMDPDSYQNPQELDGLEEDVSKGDAQQE